MLVTKTLTIFYKKMITSVEKRLLLKTRGSIAKRAHKIVKIRLLFTTANRIKWLVYAFFCTKKSQVKLYKN